MHACERAMLASRDESAHIVEADGDHLGEARELHHCAIVFGAALEQRTELVAVRAGHETHARAGAARHDRLDVRLAQL